MVLCSRVATPKHLLVMQTQSTSCHHCEVLDHRRFTRRCPDVQVLSLGMAISMIFHTVHGVLKARILKWFAIPFSSGPRFVRTLHHDPSILGGSTQRGSHSFIELDKAVVHVISLVNFL